MMISMPTPYVLAVVKPHLISTGRTGYDLTPGD